MKLDIQICKAFKYSKAISENPYINMDALIIQFIDAEFIEDFGPWVKGYKPYDLTFNPESMKLIESNQWGELVKDCSVELVCNYTG